MNLLQNYEKIFILASFFKTKYNNSDFQPLVDIAGGR